MYKDFEYLSLLVEEFFAKSRTKRSLKLISDNNITGWEVWLQVEFAYFLAEHESSPEWWREWPAEYDYRKEKEHSFLKPDFIIRKKGWRLESFIALEFKQHPDAGACINNMLSDVEKINKVRESEINIRSMWVLGVTNRDAKKEIHEKIHSRCTSRDIELNKECVRVKYIQNTDYAYMIF